MMMMADTFPMNSQAAGDCSIQQSARIAKERLHEATRSQKWELRYMGR
jgi:hypothetical protein